jgi:hypothetical protein
MFPLQLSGPWYFRLLTFAVPMEKDLRLPFRYRLAVLACAALVPAAAHAQSRSLVLYPLERSQG